ncbi:MAG: sigma-70 family RNA polymerase sigma factor [Candidatus Poribacteria bacterium]|nr:sigma-70 family RNA polymerase sigma factor [Candidatus Poribacteria bacterium]
MKNEDVALIQRILIGDENAFACLIGKYEKQVHAHAWRRIRDFHIAEDITQETFLQVYQKLETLEDATQFSRWLYKIVNNLCNAWFRKNRIKTESLEETDISEIETEAYSQYVATEHAQTTAEAQRDLVEKLLAKLNESDREVIMLHYFEEMTSAEIGTYLGVSENTVKSRIRRARQRLKKYEFMIQETLDITAEREQRSQHQLKGDIIMAKEVKEALNNRSNGTRQASNQILSDTEDYMQWRLPEGAKARLGKGNITGNVAFSPDGNRLAVGSCIGIWIYDVRPGKEKEINLLTEGTGKVNVLAFSPNGKIIASGDLDKKVRLWEADTGQDIATLTGHTWEITSIAFSPDGNTLASSSGILSDFMEDFIEIEPEIRLWNVQTKEIKTTLKGHMKGITCVAFSPDGNTLASSSRDQTVQLWDTQTGEQKSTLAENKGTISAVTYSPDGNILAFAYRNTVKLFDKRTDTHNITVQGDRRNVNAVAFSPDSTTITTGHHDAVHLWDAQTGKHKTTFKVNKKSVRSIAYSPIPSVAYSPDGNTLATTGTDHIVQLWDVQTGKRRKTFKGHTGTFTSLAYSPNGRTIAAGSRRGVGFLWNPHTRQHIATFKGHTSHISALSYTPDGDTVATIGRDGSVRLWDAGNDASQKHTRKHKEIFISHPDEFRAMAYAPDGNTIATGGTEGTVCLWNAQTGKKIAALEGYTDTINALAFAPNSTTLASAGDAKTIRLWSVQTKQVVVTFEGHTEGPNSVAFSPDGTILASASDDKSVRLWDVQTGMQKTMIETTPRLRYISVLFSPNGDIIVTGSRDHLVQLWNTQTGELIATLTGHTAGVNNVVFSPDGNIIASGSHDGTILLWELR